MNTCFRLTTQILNVVSKLLFMSKYFLCSIMSLWINVCEWFISKWKRVFLYDWLVVYNEIFCIYDLGFRNKCLINVVLQVFFRNLLFMLVGWLFFIFVIIYVRSKLWANTPSLLIVWFLCYGLVWSIARCWWKSQVTRKTLVECEL